MVNGELIKECKFDYLDINHEFTRYQKRLVMEKEMDVSENTVPGPPAVDIKTINVKIDSIRLPTST